MEFEREYAARILDALEDLLEAKNITVPCGESEEADRAKDGEAARLYGTPYYEIEDAVTDTLEASCTQTGRKNIIDGVFDEIKDALKNNGTYLLDTDSDSADILRESIADTVDLFLADERLGQR